MLVTDGLVKGTALHTDFIEINVEPQRVKHVSLSQYGFMRFPYFGEILLEQKHYDFCVGLLGTELQQSRESINAYMATNTINLKARDFASYCQALYEQKTINTPNDQQWRMKA